MQKKQRYKFLIYFIAIFLVILAGCSSTYNLKTWLSNSDLSEESKVLYAFITRASRQIGEKYKMSPCSIGGGSNKGIWLMSFSFQRYGSPLDEQKARRLLINCLHDYLELVDKDEEIRSYLKSYPFKAKNIDMGIFNYDPDTRLESFHPNISIASIDEGNITYYTLEKENMYQFKSKKYETYDEAIAILEKEKIRDL